MVIHEFKGDLAWANKRENRLFVEAVYKQVYGSDFLTATLCTDRKLQAAGVDSEISLRGGRVVLSEEKLRRKKWNDLLVEITSSASRRTVGWIAKPDQQTEIFTYGFASAKLAWVFNWAALRNAWLANGEAWVKQYGVKSAPNGFYESLNVPVPLGALVRAGAAPLVVDVKEAIEEDRIKAAFEEERKKYFIV